MNHSVYIGSEFLPKIIDKIQSSTTDLGVNGQKQHVFCVLWFWFRFSISSEYYLIKMSLSAHSTKDLHHILKAF